MTKNEELSQDHRSVLSLFLWGKLALHLVDKNHLDITISEFADGARNVHPSANNDVALSKMGGVEEIVRLMGILKSRVTDVNWEMMVARRARIVFKSKVDASSLKSEALRARI